MVRETPYGITVYPSVWKLLSLAVVSALFAVGCYWALGLSQSVGTSIGLYLMIGFCGLGCLILLARLLIAKPFLTTSEEGITLALQIYALRPRTYPWENIAALMVFKRNADQFGITKVTEIVLILNDPEHPYTYTPTTPSLNNHSWIQMLRLAFRNPRIPSSYVPMKAGDLVRLIAQRNASEIARFGIVMRDTPEPTTKRQRRG